MKLDIKNMMFEISYKYQFSLRFKYIKDLKYALLHKVISHQAWRFEDAQVS